jgi:tetratricopeptide (TPR) repeat protein
MALRFYGINVTQKELGDYLRPYQIPSGDNDDKSVTLDELAEKSKGYGFTPYYRPNGTPDLIKKFIANDIPVIARTWTKPNEDIGHYRIIKGYDDARQVFIQDDSLQGKNLKFTYDDFNIIWGKFNYEYLVLIPKEKINLAKDILGEDKDFKKSWTRASQNSTGLNKSVALYRIGDLKGSVAEFEKVENNLPKRALWYQIEPILAYYELGNYDRVFEITNKILEGGNRAFSELYIIRGKIYKIQGNMGAARSEFEKAVLYNKNLEEAQELLKSIS